MPRGLGDDPLKRGRKTKRSSQAAPNAAGVARAEPTASSSGSGRYNDVFFQRRSEPVPASPGSQATVAIEAPPEVPAVETLSAAPVEISAAPEAALQSTTEAPLVEAAAPPPAPEPEAAPAPTEQADASQPAQTPPEPQKSGFFSRIFGKLRK